ncbi:TPA: hypothetical protein SMF87_004575 [Serratia marcescens]|nr:hypothetical protein [Serratia marcescens]
MFDKDDEVISTGMNFGDGKLISASPYDRMPEDDEELEEPEGHELDTDEMQEMHRQLLGRYENELDRQGENRDDMAVDEDFYDNIQWTAEDASALKERGQMPLVYNVISSSVNWVIGTEKRGRTDFRILPRRKDGSKPAERKTKLLKYLSDVNRTPFHFSRAFEDCVKVGIGWVEDGVQGDDDGEPIYSRYESWRNILWDSACTEKDLSDARYIFRVKWVDLDIAISMFPDRKEYLKQSAVEYQHYGIDNQGDYAMDSMEAEMESYSSTRSNQLEFKRERVRMIECWFRKPANVKVMSGGDFAGEIFDSDSPAVAHQAQIDAGRAVVVEKVRMRMHVAIFTPCALMYIGESPYRHNSYPFTPIWCYRRGRDGMPYGMIRGMRDIQQDINKRASKALWILSTNKVIMDEGAVEDIDEFRDEVSRPDAVIVKKTGKEMIINAERELAPAHLDLMSRSIAMIQSQSGVTDENLGRATNATSGKAITARQEQGSMATAGIFDNLRFAKQVQGEKQLSLVEQYFDQEKEFRITNMRGTPEYITINDGLPENDIVRSKADFIISESDWRASVRQAQTEELMALLAQLAPVAPQVAMVMLDLIIEGMDITNRDELVKRIRDVTGMRDPDAEELTPEEKAAAEAKAKAEQAAQELQQRDALATIAGKEAKAQRDQVAAQKDAATIQKIGADTANVNVATQQAAMGTATTALQIPQAVPAADTILKEAGFVSRSEQEQMAEEQAMQEQQAMEAQQQQQQMEQEAQQQAQAEQQAQQSGDPAQGMPQPPQQ